MTILPWLTMRCCDTGDSEGAGRGGQLKLMDVVMEGAGDGINTRVMNTPSSRLAQLFGARMCLV